MVWFLLISPKKWKFSIQNVPEFRHLRLPIAYQLRVRAKVDRQHGASSLTIVFSFIWRGLSALPAYHGRILKVSVVTGELFIKV